MQDKVNIEALELVYKLNFHNYCQDVINFTIASWNLANQALNEMSMQSKLTSKQKVAVYIMAKSMRLVRAAKMLIEVGDWTETLPLRRSQLELQYLLFYILQDKTNKKADKWLKMKNKQSWPINELIKSHEKLGDNVKNDYHHMSSLSHNHSNAFYAYLQFKKDGKFGIIHTPLGGKGNNEIAEYYLGEMANRNASFCEIAHVLSSLSAKWQKMHNDLQRLPYYKKITSKIKHNQIELASNFLEFIIKS
jgi:hypothetical protein